MNIYISAFFDAKPRILPHAEAIKQMGHRIVSSWLKESVFKTDGKAAGELAVTLGHGYMECCAVDDVAEIRQAHLFVVDTEDISPRGGREVELGYALAWGVPTVLIGPRRNVFHYLCWRWFEDWEKFLSFLSRLEK